MKGITAFEALTDIRGDYILDAEIDTVRLAMPLPKKERSPSPFSRFINSGWGVAIVCALVAVSVMGGILWAGFYIGHQSPGHTVVPTGEVYLTASDKVITPEAFFGHSKVVQGDQYAISSGSGFDGAFTVSPIPTLTSIDDLCLHMPDNYRLEEILVYAPASPTAVLYTFEGLEDLKALAPNTYYIALRITHTEGMSTYCYDYAFCLTVTLPLMKRPYDWPGFSPPASAFLGSDTGSYPEGGSTANLSLTAAYTQVKMPDGFVWYVMTARYAKEAGNGYPLLLLYDPQNTPEESYVAMDRQLGHLYPPLHTLLQLEDGRIITLHGESNPPRSQDHLEIIAHTWIWSKVDPDTGEALDRIQLCPIGESWSYTFDLTDSLSASRDWQYAFAAYVLELTEGNPPTLRVLLDDLFCETADIQYDVSPYEHFSEEDTSTTGWTRLQRIMNGWLRPDLWRPPKELNLRIRDAALGTYWDCYFRYDGTLLYAHSKGDGAYVSVYTGTYKIANGRITINSPDVDFFMAYNLNGTHSFQLVTSATGHPLLLMDQVGGGAIPMSTTLDDTQICLYIPKILEILADAGQTPEKYTLVDMDGDGHKEIVVQIPSADPDHLNACVFFVLPEWGKITGHTWIHNYNILYEDGSFRYTLHRPAPSYGRNRLIRTEDGYQQDILWRVIDDGTDKVTYGIGLTQVQKAAFDEYVNSIACDQVLWRDCFWEHVTYHPDSD